MDNLSLTNWTIIVLIILGLIGIVLALIWTKIIKRNTWINCNKSIFTINFVIDEIKKSEFAILKKEYAIIKNPFLSLLEKNSSCFFNLNNILITKKNIYFITYELSNKARKISLENGKVVLRDKKNKKFSLPIEIESAILNAKYIEEFIDNKIVIITPCYNNEIKSSIKGWKNSWFVSRNKISDFINEYEANSDVSIFSIENIRMNLSKINYKKKMKLPFFSLKHKDNIWEK